MAKTTCCHGSINTSTFRKIMALAHAYAESCQQQEANQLFGTRKQRAKALANRLIAEDELYDLVFSITR